MLHYQATLTGSAMFVQAVSYLEFKDKRVDSVGSVEVAHLNSELFETANIFIFDT